MTVHDPHPSFERIFGTAGIDKSIGNDQMERQDFGWPDGLGRGIMVRLNENDRIARAVRAEWGKICGSGWAKVPSIPADALFTHDGKGFYIDYTQRVMSSIS